MAQGSYPVLASSRQFDKVQSSMFKVQSFLANLGGISKLETLNFELDSMPHAVSQPATDS